MGFRNYKGVSISLAEAMAEQWSGWPVRDDNGNPVVIDETLLHPLTTTASGSASSGTLSVKTGATMAAIGRGVNDGDIAVLKVGAWPATEYVDLSWDAVGSQWVSRPQPLLTQSDLTYMGTNTTTYTYVSTNNSGAVTGGIGWTTRALRQASSLFAAGLSLQANFSALCSGSGTPAASTFQTFFFQHNSGDTVVFSADGSAAVGWLNSPIVTPSDNTVRFQSTGWQTVCKNGLAAALSSADVTLGNLWPRIYAKNASGTSYSSIIDTDLQARWVG